MTHTGFFRVWTTLLVAVLAVIVLSAAAPTTGAGAQEAGCSGQVVLDAGHGGTDPGAKNETYGLTEMEQTLDAAERLQILLEDEGCTVYMTRRPSPTTTATPTPTPRVLISSSPST